MPSPQPSLKFVKNSHSCQSRVTFPNYSARASNIVGIRAGHCYARKANVCVNDWDEGRTRAFQRSIKH